MATTDPETRTDWRDVASETAAFARRVGWKPLALLLGAVCAIAVVAFLAGVRYGSSRTRGAAACVRRCPAAGSDHGTVDAAGTPCRCSATTRSL